MPATAMQPITLAAATGRLAVVVWGRLEGSGECQGLPAVPLGSIANVRTPASARRTSVCSPHRDLLGVNAGPLTFALCNAVRALRDRVEAPEGRTLQASGQ
jgi:hypothetical protein